MIPSLSPLVHFILFLLFSCAPSLQCDQIGHQARASVFPFIYKGCRLNLTLGSCGESETSTCLSPHPMANTPLTPILSFLSCLFWPPSLTPSCSDTSGLLLFFLHFV